MDRIIVRTNADMQRVIDWASKLEGVPVKLAFPEAEISFEEELITLRFRDEGNSVIWFECLMDGRKVVEWRCNTETWEIPELIIAAEGEQKKSQMAMLLMMDNTVDKCVRKFRALMLFAAYYREEVRRSAVVERTVKPGKRSGGKKNNRRMLTTRKYLISEELLSELPQPKRKYQKHTESWGVRGHYRTLRSGKTVWVRPFTKGKSEKREDKEYLV